jgi:hypothetical protein
LHGRGDDLAVDINAKPHRHFAAEPVGGGSGGGTNLLVAAKPSQRRARLRLGFFVQTLDCLTSRPSRLISDGMSQAHAARAERATMSSALMG